MIHVCADVRYTVILPDRKDLHKKVRVREESLASFPGLAPAQAWRLKHGLAASTHLAVSFD